MMTKVKDILVTIVIMLFIYLVFYPVVWVDNRWSDYLRWYYTKRNIPFKVINDKFTDVIVRLDR